MNPTVDKYWKQPTEYQSFYNWRILGYVDMTCCAITLISNAFIIAIFTRKHMISPVNTIFTHIAITESLTLICYIPRSWQEYFRVTECKIAQHRTYVWEMISVYSYIIAFMFRHVGVCLVSMLAVWRYIAVIHPLRERSWSNMQITRKFIITAYILAGLLTIPPYFALDYGPAEKFLNEEGCIVTNNTNGTNTTTIYEFQIPIENYRVVLTIATICYGGIKTLPSFAIAFISYKLISTVREASKRRREMILESEHDDRPRCNSKTDHTDRITKILVIILVLFIIGEVPHGIFCFCVAYHGPEFFWSYYYYGQEVSNCLTHISESFNFVIYYSMSSKFRKAFSELFGRN